jgi:hypothetical protein
MYLIHVHLQRGRGRSAADDRWWSDLRTRLSTVAGVRHVAVHPYGETAVVLGAYVVAGSATTAEITVRRVVLHYLTHSGPARGTTLLRCAATAIAPPED